MDLFADINPRVSPRETSVPVEPVLPEQFSRDKVRSAEATEQMEVVKMLLEQCDVPDEIKRSLTINASTLDVQRHVPTREEKIRALWDFWTFIDIINFHGGSLAFSDCHRETVEWRHRPDAKFRQLILEARGMLKSTLYCVAYVLWRIYQNPNIRMFVGTESLKLSKSFIREIESYLTDEFLQENVWNSRPHVDGPLIPTMDSLGKSRRSLIRDISAEFGDEFATGAAAASQKKVWRAEAIQVVRSRALKEPTVVAGSVGQTATGMHFDEIVFDDIHTFKNCSSAAQIEKVYSWIYDMESVLDPPTADVELVNRFYSVMPNTFANVGRWAISGGRVTVLGTRYDEEDYYGHILRNKEALGFEVHERNIYANGVDNSDGYRWPEKWNEELETRTLAQFQTRLGSAGVARFYSQYLGKIVNEETQILKWDNVQWIRPGSVVLDGPNRFVRIFNTDGTVQAEFRPRMCIDPTSTDSKTSDFCAIAVGGVYEGKFYIIDFWMKQTKVGTWLAKMWEFVYKWNLFDAVIEMVGGFKVLEFTIQEMIRNNPDKYRPISIHSYNPPTNSSEGKHVRIEATLSPLLDNGMLYMPMSVSQNSDLRTQFQFFGKATTKDDGPDVISILYENAFRLQNFPQNSATANEPKVHPIFGGVYYGEDVENPRKSHVMIERELDAA